MEKVKLPREVAEAIEELRKLGYTDYQLAWNVCNNARPHERFHSINDQEGDKVIRAIYIGYEVVDTPEDKVRELYEYFNQPDVAFAGIDVQNKIARMFTLLDIPIRGVNKSWNSTHI